jgi:hypothetical protein
LAEPKSNEEAPKGFVKVGLSIEGWYSPEVDEKRGLTGIVQGVPLSREEREGKKGPMVFYAFRLTKPGRFTLAEDETIDLKAGAVIGVGERHALRPLEDYLGIEVWIKSLGKKETANGNTVWLFDIQASKIAPKKPPKKTEEGDEVPF